MNEDDLLRRLAETAREEEEAERQRLDPRWDRLAAGTLAPADEEALRAEAGSSPEAREALEAFSPLDAGFRARRVEEARRMLRDGTATGRETGETGVRTGRGARPAAWSRSRLRWPAAAAVLAAAGLLWMLRPEGDLGPLPAYVAELRGGVQEMRGEVDEMPQAPAWSTVPQVFAPGSVFELVLRPEREVREPPEMRAFLLHGGELRSWRPPVEVAETGAARLSGEVGREIVFPEGESTLLVAIGRPGSLPSGDELRERLAAPGLHQTSAEDWAAWKLEVVFEAALGSP